MEKQLWTSKNLNRLPHLENLNYLGLLSENGVEGLVCSQQLDEGGRDETEEEEEKAEKEEFMHSSYLIITSLLLISVVSLMVSITNTYGVNLQNILLTKTLETNIE